MDILKHFGKDVIKSLQVSGKMMICFSFITLAHKISHFLQMQNKCICRHKMGLRTEHVFAMCKAATYFRHNGLEATMLPCNEQCTI